MSSPRVPQTTQQTMPLIPAQVEALIAAGVITHQVKGREALDPLFAISKLYDLPGVRFVAAFQEGQIFLGCPDAPPAKLEGLIEAVKSDPRAPEFDHKIDVLIDSVDALHSETEDRIAAGLKRINSVSHRLEFIADAMELDKRATDEIPIAKLQQDVASLSSVVKGIHHRVHQPPQNEAALDRIAGSVADAIQGTKMQATTAQAKFDDVSAAVAAMTRELAKLTTQNYATDDGSDPVELAQLTEKLDALMAGVSALDERLGKGQPSTALAVDQIIPTLNKILRISEAQTQHTQETTARIKAADASKALSTLQTQVAKIAQTIESTVSGESLVDMLAQMNTGIETLAARISSAAHTDDIKEIREGVSALANQPPPELDLTEQQRSFAHFAAKMSAIVKNVETTAARLTPSDGDVTSEQVMHAVLDLPTQLASNLPQPPDLTAIEAQLSALHHQLQSSDAPHIALTSRLDALSDAATSELSELKSEVTNFFERFEATKKSLLDLDPLMARLDTLTAETYALPETIETLRAEIVTLAERPMPPLDLTAQKESLARFEDASGSIVQRLEDSIQSLMSAQTASKDDTQELKAVMQALPAILQQALDEKLHSDPVPGAISELQDHLACVPEKMAELTGLRDAIETLVRRPSPVMDLAEQRRSFARFATAISMVVNRLEHVATQLGEAQNTDPDAPDLRVVLDTIQAVGAELSRAAGGQTEQVAALDARIAAFPDKVIERLKHGLDVTAVVPEENEGRSLDDMRFIFAEMIAGQIRANATEGQVGYA